MSISVSFKLAKTLYTVMHQKLVSKLSTKHVSTPSCPWSHGVRPKKLSVSVAVPPAPVRVPSQRPLAPSHVGR